MNKCVMNKCQVIIMNIKRDSTSLYWGLPGSQRHSSSSSLLKERSEVMDRACCPELRISHAICTAAPVSLETKRMHQEINLLCANKNAVCYLINILLMLLAHANSNNSKNNTDVYLRCEWGHASAKLPLRFSKSLSLNMLSLKKASSWKKTCDTLDIEDSSPESWAGSCSKRVRVIPPRDSRSKQSGFVDSDWPVWAERPVIERRHRKHMH